MSTKKLAPVSKALETFTLKVAAGVNAKIEMIAAGVAYGIIALRNDENLTWANDVRPVLEAAAAAHGAFVKVAAAEQTAGQRTKYETKTTIKPALAFIGRLIPALDGVVPEKVTDADGVLSAVMERILAKATTKAGLVSEAELARHYPATGVRKGKGGPKAKAKGKVTELAPAPAPAPEPAPTTETAPAVSPFHAALAAIASIDNPDELAALANAISARIDALAGEMAKAA